MDQRRVVSFGLEGLFNVFHFFPICVQLRERKYFDFLISFHDMKEDPFFLQNFIPPASFNCLDSVYYTKLSALLFTALGFIVGLNCLAGILWMNYLENEWYSKNFSIVFQLSYSAQ